MLLLAVPAGLAQADAGDLDPSFDGDGKRTLDYGGVDGAQAVLAQPDGKILVVGYGGGADQDVTVSRLNRDVSSGRADRHRLDRGGNRQINAAIHRVAVTRARCHPETIDFLARKKTEGKTHREAIRSPQAPPRPPHLATAAHAPPDARNTAPPINFLTKEQHELGVLDRVLLHAQRPTSTGGHDVGNDVAIQPDGKIVAAVDASNGGSFALARALP